MGLGAHEPHGEEIEGGDEGRRVRELRNRHEGHQRRSGVRCEIVVTQGGAPLADGVLSDGRSCLEAPGSPFTYPPMPRRLPAPWHHWWAMRKWLPGALRALLSNVEKLPGASLTAVSNVKGLA